MVLPYRSCRSDGRHRPMGRRDKRCRAGPRRGARRRPRLAATSSDTAAPRAAPQHPRGSRRSGERPVLTNELGAIVRRAPPHERRAAAPAIRRMQAGARGQNPQGPCPRPRTAAGAEDAGAASRGLRPDQAVPGVGVDDRPHTARCAAARLLVVSGAPARRGGVSETEAASESLGTQGRGHRFKRKAAQRNGETKAGRLAGQPLFHPTFSPAGY